MCVFVFVSVCACVCAKMQQSCSFVSRLMFKLCPLRLLTVKPVSSTSFLGLCCLAARSPGMDKGANSGIATSQKGIQLCVYMCRCVFEWCVYCSREGAGRPDCFFPHTRSVDSFTHHCGEHTDTLIRIWALSAASATVQQSNVGIKGVSHQSRAERLQFVTCEHSPILQFVFYEGKLWLKLFFVALTVKFMRGNYIKNADK